MWNLANNVHKEVLHTTINVAIRRAMSTPWCITNRQFRKEAKIKILEQIIAKTTTNTMQNMKEPNQTYRQSKKKWNIEETI